MQVFYPPSFLYFCDQKWDLSYIEHTLNMTLERELAFSRARKWSALFLLWSPLELLHKAQSEGLTRYELESSELLLFRCSAAEGEYPHNLRMRRATTDHLSAGCNNNSSLRYKSNKYKSPIYWYQWMLYTGPVPAAERLGCLATLTLPCRFVGFAKEISVASEIEYGRKQ